MDKQKLAFGKTNFILIAAGMLAVIMGFVLMAGPSSSAEHFEPDIFSARRIRVAPVVSLLGFVFMIYGVLHNPRGTKGQADGYGKEA